MPWFVYGAICLAVGIWFRFAPLLARDSRWRPVALVVAIPFAAAPNSLIPWGAALLLFGIAQSIPATNVWAPLLALLALVSFVCGTVFLFWAPSWIRPKSLRGLDRSKLRNAPAVELVMTRELILASAGLGLVAIGVAALIARIGDPAAGMTAIGVGVIAVGTVLSRILGRLLRDRSGE